MLKSTACSLKKMNAQQLKEFNSFIKSTKKKKVSNSVQNTIQQALGDEGLIECCKQEASNLKQASLVFAVYVRMKIGTLKQVKTLQISNQVGGAVLSCLKTIRNIMKQSPSSDGSVGTYFDNTTDEEIFEVIQPKLTGSCVLLWDMLVEESLKYENELDDFLACEYELCNDISGEIEPCNPSDPPNTTDDSNVQNDHEPFEEKKELDFFDMAKAFEDDSIDTRELLKILFYQLNKKIDERVEDLKNHHSKELEDLKHHHSMEMKDLKKEMYVMNNHTSKNIGTLYEMLICSNFEKDDEYQVFSPFVLEQETFEIQFKDLSKIQGRWNNNLRALRGYIADPRKLQVDTPSVEINFLKRKKTSPRQVQIYEATISDLTDTNKLMTKLVQLERQIMFYRKCHPQDIIEKVGLVSTADHSVTETIGNLLDQWKAQLPRTKKMFDEKKFEHLKRGHKVEIW